MNINGNFLALIVIYFLIVYLLAVRRGGQSLVLWLVAIAVQVLTLFVLNRYSDGIKSSGLLRMLPEALQNAVLIILFLLVNVAVILIINSGGPKNSRVSSRSVEKPVVKKKRKRERDNEVNVDPMTLTPIGIMKEEDGEDTGEVDPMNMGSEELLDYIQNMLSEGNDEEARRYLRMVICYSDDRQLVGKAEKMLKGLESEEEKNEERFSE